jgi:NAD(P)-dependent dehydrogenase (short-subunit alcohol dehydrogenase family)
MAVTIEETSTVNMTSQHASVHAKPNGHGDARRTAKQIVEAENRVAGLTDKAILITGCSSGLGVETARALLTTGAELYLTSRDVEKAKKALPELIASERVHFLHLDLQSMDCVRACAKKFLEQSSKLNIIIANAGVMHTPEGKTADGFEAQFGTNFLGHYLLFNLLKLTLLASASPDFASKVVVFPPPDIASAALTSTTSISTSVHTMDGWRTGKARLRAYTWRMKSIAGTEQRACMVSFYTPEASCLGCGKLFPTR